MTSPVLAALVNARVREAALGWENAEAELWSAVAAKLEPYPEEGLIDAATLSPFVAWCDSHGVRSCPAQPASIAAFVLANDFVGVEHLSEILGAIALVHQRAGLANPVATYAVGTALMRVGSLEPPRSWSREYRPRFTELPPDLQSYIMKREAERDREVRRAQNEAATARQEVEKLENERETEAVG